MSNHFLKTCKNCLLNIHPLFHTCPICKTDNPFITNTCPICLDDVSEKDMHILSCQHFMHKKCYLKLLKDANKKCPECKREIYNQYKCSICCNYLKLDESDCDTFRSLKCGCLFHYDCIKKHRKINCNNCSTEINHKNMEPLSYIYFENAYKRWIGKIQKCKDENCNQQGNPIRYGYCIFHKKEKISETIFINALTFFSRFIIENDENKRINEFYKIIDFCSKKIITEENINEMYQKYIEINS